MELERLVELTQKYLRGEASAEEKALLDEWYYTFEGKALPVPAGAGRKVKKTLRAALFPRPVRYWYWGAALLILLAAGFFTLRPAGKKLTAGLAQHVSAILPDSSKVWVNASSKASYTRPRAIHLTGEAFFEVVHDSSHPFTVQAGDVTITDVGTSFNVKAYPGEPVVVTVASGSVRVANGGHTILLTPGQQLMVEAGLLEKRMVNAAAFTGWKDGALQFTDEPLSSIALTLERRFAIHIKLDNSVPSLRSTAGFDSTVALEQVLGMLCRVHQIHYTKISEDRYDITP